MKLSRRAIAAVALGVLGAVILVAAAAAEGRQWRFVWWEYRVAQEPGKVLTSHLAECKVRTWDGQIRVLRQDLDLGECGERSLVLGLAGRVISDHRASWLRQEALLGTPRARLRASLALELAGHATPTQPSWLAFEPGNEWLVRDVLEERLPGDWMAPVLAGRVDLLRAQSPDLTSRLHLWLQWAELGAPPTDTRWAANEVEELLSLDGGRMGDVAAAGAPWEASVAGLEDCFASEPCLEGWNRVLLAEAETLESFEVSPGDLSSWWALRSPDAVSILDGVLQQHAEWIRASDDPPLRLFGWLDEGEEADPARAMWSRNPTPWLHAALLLDVARRAELDVRFELGRGHWRATIGTHVEERTWCEGANPPVASVPLRAVIARAVLEDVDTSGARALAYRLDDSLGSTGGTIGSRLAGPVDPLVGGEAAREESAMPCSGG